MSPRILCDGRAVLHVGDCLEILRTMPDNSVDAVVTDANIAEARISHAYRVWQEDRRQGSLFGGKQEAALVGERIDSAIGGAKFKVEAA